MAVKQHYAPESWVDRHGDVLFRYALVRVRDHAVAEELVQEALLAALQSYESFSGQSSERTWLIGILKHKITDHYRRLSRTSQFNPDDEVAFEHDELFQRSGEWRGHWNFDLGPPRVDDEPGPRRREERVLDDTEPLFDGAARTDRRRFYSSRSGAVEH
ncbi:MAG TPA: sigma factor [Blastocatellia bacterium]|nr:sigma factor [Blastocatellia bacterium]